MKMRGYAQRTTIICSVITMLAVAALAQAPQPAISDAGSGSIPSEPGMYVQTAGGFNKILGQIVEFTRSGSLLVSKLTVGIKTTKQNAQLLGPHAQTASSMASWCSTSSRLSKKQKRESMRAT